MAKSTEAHRTDSSAQRRRTPNWAGTGTPFSRSRSHPVSASAPSGNGMAALSKHVPEMPVFGMTSLTSMRTGRLYYPRLTCVHSEPYGAAVNKEDAERYYDGLKRAGVIQNYELERVETTHQSKGVAGRVADWLKWRTPLRRWFGRPVPTEIYLSTVLERIRDHADPDTAKLIKDSLLESLRGVKVVEMVRPPDPYEVLEVDVLVAPMVPIQYVSLEVTLPPPASDESTS